MKYFLLFLLIIPKIIYSQAIVLTDVSGKEYPNINCEYILLDENDNKIVPNISDLELIENGLKQQILNEECDNIQKPEPISVVITIDNSSSMNDVDGNPKNRSEVVREAAKRFIDILNAQSEVAITYFSTDSKYLQPLTTDKNTAKSAIDNIPVPLGNTYITNAFMDSNDGNFRALENAKYKKVILFLTDGVSREVDENAILSKAKSDGVTIYNVSIYSKLDDELIDISNLTGGKSFEDIESQESIVNIYRALGHIASGVSTCKFSYISDNCSMIRNLELNYKHQFKDFWKLELSKESLTEYKIFPTDIKLFKTNNSNSYGYSNIVSNKDSLIISSITAKYSEVTIDEPALSDFPIRLDRGQRLRFRLNCLNDDRTKSDVIEIVSNSCENKEVTFSYNPVANSLRLIQPNGGENYYVGSTQSIKWDDTRIDSKYKIDYSTDAGFEWKPIVNEYNGKDIDWEKIPDEVTDEALMKVTPVESQFNLADTKSVGVIKPNLFSEFDNVLILDSNQYLVTTTFRENFQYRNFYIDTVGQPDIEKSRVRRILLKLDENLDVVKYKTISDDFKYLSLAKLKGNIYLLGGGMNYLRFDTLDYQIESGYSYNAILVKIDSNLDYKSYKPINFRNPLISDNSNLIDFKTSDNYLHIYGACSKDLIYDGNLEINSENSRKINFLAKIDNDLNMSEINYWDRDNDGFDVRTSGIIPLDDKKVVLWGTGYGYGMLGLDSNYYKIFALNTTYGSRNITIKNYISYDESFDFTLMDFKSYKDINFYLLKTTDTTYLDKERVSFGEVDSKVRLLAVSDDNNLLWNRAFDDFTLDKNISIFKNKDIILSGRTNESFSLGDTTVPRYSNVHFITSMNLFTGKFNWLRYIKNAVYGDILVNNDKYILTNGKIYSKVDFGNGYKDSVNIIDGETEKQYLWALEGESGSHFDISDSLWSIKKTSFQYIDTIDFGKVYVGSKKDSLVTNFIKRTLPGDVTIKSIKIDDFRFTNNFSGPKDLVNNLDIIITFDTDIPGANITRGEIETTQGKYYFYVKGEETDLRYSANNPDSLNIDFGDVFVTDSKSANRLIAKNKGEAVIGIDSVVIENDTNKEYNYNITTDKTHIFSLDKLESEFTFQPKLAGVSTSKVNFYLDVDKKPIAVTLRGNGITRDSVRLKIKVDSVSSFPDNLTTIPLRLIIGENPSSLDLQRIEVDIDFNATLILPFRFENEGSVINKIRYLTLVFNKQDIENSILESRYLPTIGNNINTIINVDSVRIYNSNNQLIDQNVIEKENGLFTLEGVCLSNGHYRLYEQSSSLSMKILKDNGENFVNYNLIEEGITNISIYDISGKLVTTLVNSNLQIGEHKAEFTTKYMSNGNYILRLETPTQVISQIFSIIK